MRTARLWPHGQRRAVFFPYSSSLRTARNASVGSCTLPRERIFFLPAPEKLRFIGGPWRPPSSAGQARLRQGHGFAATLDAASRQVAFAPGGQKAALSLLVQLEDRQKCLRRQLYAAKGAHLFLARPGKAPLYRRTPAATILGGPSPPPARSRLRRHA